MCGFSLFKYFLTISLINIINVVFLLMIKFVKLEKKYAVSLSLKLNTRYNGNYFEKLDERNFISFIP